MLIFAPNCGTELATAGAFLCAMWSRIEDSQAQPRQTGSAPLIPRGSLRQADLSGLSRRQRALEFAVLESAASSEPSLFNGFCAGLVRALDRKTWSGVDGSDLTQRYPSRTYRC